LFKHTLLKANKQQNLNYHQHKPYFIKIKTILKEIIYRVYTLNHRVSHLNHLKKQDY